MPQQLNPSEEFVHWVCQQSFLSLWSYAAPRGKKGKELCDILIVCDPDVVIISVKDIALADAENETARQRWRKHAVDESVKQINGAERWIKGAKNVIRSDGSEGLSIPDASTLQIHRLAVAFGGNGKVSFNEGDAGKGYVHVLDEQSFRIVLSELNTITDFVQYLAAKESLTKRATVIFEGEENLLAIYVHNGREFPDGDFFIIQDGIWPKLVAKPEFQRREAANRDSYIWDRIIESVSHDVLSDRLEIGPGLAQSELALRVMARENRFCRRLLGKLFAEFVFDARRGKTRSRLIPSLSGVRYVLLTMPADDTRHDYVPELDLRCYVARGMSSDCSTVIGIGVSDDPGKHYALTLIYHDYPDWTEEDIQRAKEIQDEFDYFAASRSRPLAEDEYPAATGGDTKYNKAKSTRQLEQKARRKKKLADKSRRRNRRR